MKTYHHFIITTLLLSCRVDPSNDEPQAGNTRGTQPSSNSSTERGDNSTPQPSGTTHAVTTAEGDAGRFEDASSTAGVSHDSALPDVLTTEGGANDSATSEQALDAGQDSAAHDARRSDAAVRSNTDECVAIPLACGDRVSHNTVDYGAGNTWYGYDRSQRGESGKEVLYLLHADVGCHVNAVLSELEADLDLFLLGVCEPHQSAMPSLQASSTPIDIQTTENLVFTTTADALAFIVVEGYNGEEGSYSLEVTCECP
jgi:hypothetical protein